MLIQIVFIFTLQWAGTGETMNNCYLKGGAVALIEQDLRRAALGPLPAETDAKATVVKEQLSLLLSADRPQKLQFEFSAAGVQLLNESLIRAQTMIDDFGEDGLWLLFLLQGDLSVVQFVPSLTTNECENNNNDKFCRAQDCVLFGFRKGQHQKGQDIPRFVPATCSPACLL